jgi:hypothetical protein
VVVCKPLVQFLDLGAHLHPQLSVEVRKRLVEQEDLRIAHDGPAHRDPLALAAGKLARITVQELCQTEDLCSPVHARIDDRFGRSREPERKRHVLPHGHVRIEGIVLKDHRDVAFLGRNVVYDPRADGDLAAGHVLKARDHAEQRRLAAAGRADQDDELPVADFDIDAVQHLGRAERLAHAPKRDRSHGSLGTLSASRSAERFGRP